MVRPSEIETYIENFSFNIGEIVEQLSLMNKDNELYSELFSDICANYRRMGIAILLLEADVDAFYHCLFKSAQAFLAYLNIAKTNPSTDRYHLATGRSSPLFDAIVCQDLNTAKEISKLTRHAFSSGEEYEDDFCYFYFLMQLYFLQASSGELEKTLQQFQGAVKNHSSARLDLCKSLLEKDEKQFNLALMDLIDAHKERFAVYRKKENELPEIIDTCSNIYIEGIALVWLAELRDMTTEKEYSLIPSIARLPMKQPYPPRDSWRQP